MSDLPPKVILDFTGAKVHGVVEHLQDRDYALRYTGTDGAIYRSLYRDRFPYLGIKVGPAVLAIKPDRPGDFQPAGASYIPGIMTAALVFCAITILGYVRRMIFRRHQAKTGVELRGVASVIRGKRES
jgi:hypothetical protein